MSSSAGVLPMVVPEYLGVLIPNTPSKKLVLSKVDGVDHPKVLAKFFSSSFGTVFLINVIHISYTFHKQFYIVKTPTKHL